MTQLVNGWGHVRPVGFEIGQVVWSAVAQRPGIVFQIADGTLLSRRAHPELNAKYAALGYPFGSGDGVNTFGIPNLVGRTPIGTGTGPSLTVRALGDSVGSSSHTLSVPEMPAHTHPYVDSGDAGGDGVGATGSQNLMSTDLATNTDYAGGGQSHENRQPFTTLTPWICIR